MLSAVDAGTPPRPVIFGLAGYTMTRDEEAFFRASDPLGFILFARNIRAPEQLAELTSGLKACMGRDVPVLIDQEGGRVARMKPPHWPAWPSPRAAAVEGCVADVNRAMAQALRAVGVNVNCVPVVDVYFDGVTHAAIGDRALSSDPVEVGVLGAEICRACLAEGVVPVLKHMPGQGRADLDSHMALPVLDTPLAELERTDFVPYRHILGGEFARAVWGMVSHVVYTAIDSKHPASCSPGVIDMIRKDLGFAGVLLSDDIVMQALGTVGDMGQRAAASVAAGCDAVLHCNGIMAEMEQVAQALPRMAAGSVARFNAAIANLESVRVQA